MDLLERITPKKINEFVGNKLVVKNFQDLLHPTNPAKVIGLTGPEGCGKTLLCNLMFDFYKFDVLHISKDNYTSKESLQSMINFISHRTIDSYFHAKKKIVFIDDLDVLVSVDRFVMSNIQTILPYLESTSVKLILVCNSNDDRKLFDFKKNCEIVKLGYPNTKDAYAYFLSLGLDLDEEELLHLVKYYRGNFRDIVLNIKYGNQHNFDKNIFKDMNNFEVIQKVFQEGCEFKNLKFLISDDVSVLSFLLYENLPDELFHNKLKAQLQDYTYVNDAFMNTCILENYIYDCGMWNIFDIINIIRILAITSLMNKVESTKTYKPQKYRFSQALSKVSHRNMLRKRVKNLQEDIKLDPENLYLVADLNISKQQKLKPSSDLHNFVSTYEKYFS